MKRFFAILVGCAVMGSAAAQERVVIDYSRMDLTTPAGANALYLRILNVAEAVCPQESVLGVYGHSLWRKCMQNAIDRAVEDVHNPLLTARYRGETSGRLYSSRGTMK